MRGTAPPLRLAELVRSFHLGGTEGQVVELLRGLPADCQVHVCTLRFSGPLTEQVTELGYQPTEFPLAGSVMRPQTLLQVGRMARWLRRTRVQLVHAHDFYGTVLAVPAAKLAGCKVIVGRLDLAHWHNSLQRAVLREWTRMADHVIANAAAIRDQLMTEEKIPAHRISVVHNGLDIHPFDTRARLGLSRPVPELKGEPAILHVANMNHVVKRQEDLLEALALLGREGVRCHVLFVGDGPRRAELEALAQRWGVKGRAHFLGHRTDVPALYRFATVGVLCSTHEGLSNAVIEGMAASLPMVVTRVGGNPELIADAVRGRVVTPQRPSELAQALAEVLGDREKAAQMGRAGRKFVEEHLSLEKMVKRHHQIYRQVLRLQSGV